MEIKHYTAKNIPMLLFLTGCDQFNVNIKLVWNLCVCVCRYQLSVMYYTYIKPEYQAI